MSILRQIFETLREYYATKPDYPWWPEDPTEVILGAVLVQGTTWKSVDKVLNTFRTEKLLDFKKIVDQTEEQLADWIRPVGFQTKKASRLRAVARLILERGGDLVRFFARDHDLIRGELLSISGIGPGTADNILLYAGQVSTYMVDTFTTRILIRHGIADLHANEKQIQDLVHRELAPDEEPYGAKFFQKMQELLVRLGRDFCDKSKPNCAQCPLNIYLPEDGAIGIEMSHVRHLVASHPAAGHFTASPKSQDYTPRHVAPKPVAARPIATEPITAKIIDIAELDATERKVIEAIGEEPMPIDAVVVAVGLPVHIVRATIAVLQMKKFVSQVEGNQVKRK